MSTPILVPQLGNEITEAEVTEWLKSPGDAIEQGELIAVITTTKMSMEIEAPASGTLGAIVVPEGELAEVGATLATIE
ncbi:biotin/lipoyl-containing protein [Pelagibacterium montanilacus]|uniref:biotin/lipoyl-containing protein n=1 Tax=Pelagibacterium montanilacus TaxID=2185280 RepID=UPI000F8CC43D|nr:lipoyl domain-containing protein [Pelagibacterium montanilacus]